MEKALNYLALLELNNERSWYHAHKAEKAEADEEFASLVQELIFRCSEYDSELFYRTPKELTFRLPRDVRVWPDKPPYNPAYRAHISRGGKHMLPAGCFVYIQPGDRSCICGGFHPTSFRNATLMLREYIYYHMDEWESILENEEFAEHFTVLGEKLKNVPREYDKDVYGGEYLKHKNWYVEYPLSDEEVLSEELGEKIAQLYRIMKPFNEFINEALAEFKFPD